MPDTILIFTFSPIQLFIAEARRAGDLYAASKILVEMARAAGSVLDAGGVLISPGTLQGDVPNILIARVPADQVQTMAERAQKAADGKWQTFVQAAREHLEARGPALDATWDAIWHQQVTRCWEFYWAAAEQTGEYQQAHRKARRALDAVKRIRVFKQAEEAGLKDSLSGRRSALRAAAQDARTYWATVAEHHHAAELKPGGKERLDAVGAVKRWGGVASNAPSVSHIAAQDFLDAARKTSTALSMYRTTVEALLGTRLYRVADDPTWPYDGDLFFEETLTTERLKDSYGLEQPQPGLLEAARFALHNLRHAVGWEPRTYYAILAMDGDGMGAMMSACQTEDEQRALSQRIAAFAREVQDIVGKHLGHPVYAGGDDVLALAPLSHTLPLARELAERFRQIVDGTASAGIAVAHHLYPLDAVLAAARAAEKQAKQVPGKATVCVRVLRRSGETVEVRSPWDAMGETFGRLVGLFQSEALSSRLAYAVLEATYALPHADLMFEAELRRQLHRHRHPTKWQESEAEWAATLRTWAAALPNKAAELGRWMTLARFMAQGGQE